MAKTLKKTKTTKRTRREQVVRRDHVISFRVTDAQLNNLKAVHQRDPACGIKTSNQLARKIVCDFLAGRLGYTVASDRQKNFDLARKAS